MSAYVIQKAFETSFLIISLSVVITEELVYAIKNDNNK